MSSTALQSNSSNCSSSSSSSNEPGGRVPVLQQTAPAIPRNILSNRNVSKRCHITGFVNFVEAQPSVGRFNDDDQEPSPSTLHMTGSPRIVDVVATTIAPECNYGVFNPGGVAERDPALASPREDDLRG